MAKVHDLTATALERLQAELLDLSTRGRIQVADKIERAREMGDLSENGDYHAAKDEQGHMEGRISHLVSIITNHKLVDVLDDGQVGIGKWVTVRFEDGGVERLYLGSNEEGHANETMAPESALGAAIIGQRVDSTCQYTAPNGRILVVVVTKVEMP